MHGTVVMDLHSHSGNKHRGHVGHVGHTTTVTGLLFTFCQMPIKGFKTKLTVVVVVLFSSSSCFCFLLAVVLQRGFCIRTESEN